MNAELSRLLARVFQSPGWSVYSRGSDAKTKTEMMNMAIQAETLDKLPEEYQNLLKVCDLTLQVFDKKYPGKPVTAIDPAEYGQITRQAMAELGFSLPPETEE